ncbi:hypothetical protein Calag_0542 [Caldisphaera lagunensis DSM 15908]|uniref:Uncharacterized protein n=1 Tax=Caldisphaera lagunensis (strain DSM 15908 / JCM 11604 / ANMR 0165 / IC-154) TaxID=1056495 RepID=L0AAZ4_CALLD|nr:hypothetical protein Calag_0542 [Caldisphaera lagunensis DSM 15908]
MKILSSKEENQPQLEKNVNDKKTNVNDKKTSKYIGIALIAIGVILLVFVFYEAYLSFLNPGFLNLLGPLNSSSSNSVPISFTAEALVILLVKVAFLGISLAAASTILSKGVELIK